MRVNSRPEEKKSLYEASFSRVNIEWDFLCGTKKLGFLLLSKEVIQRDFERTSANLTNFCKVPNY